MAKHQVVYVNIARSEFVTVLARRRAQWKQLNDATVEKIVGLPWSKLKADKPESPDPRQRLEYLLKIHFENATNELLSTLKRRQGLQVLRKLLEKVELAFQRKLQQDFLSSHPETQRVTTRNDGPGMRNPQATTESSSASIASQKQIRHSGVEAPSQNTNDGTSDSSNSATVAVVAAPNANQTGGNSAVSIAPCASKTFGTKRKQAPKTVSNQPAKKKSTPARPSINTVPAPAPRQRSAPKERSSQSLDLSNAIARAGPPATRDHGRDQTQIQSARPSGGTSRSKQSSALQGQKQTGPRSCATQDPSEPKKKSPPVSLASQPSSVAANAGYVNAPRYGPETKIWFSKDKEKLACTLDARDTVSVTYRPCAMGSLAKKQILSRLGKWEPYWKIQDLVFMDQTTKVDVGNPATKPNLPPATHVLSTRLRLSHHLIEKLGGPQKFGKRHGKPEDGEIRLILQMIPLEEPSPMKGQKKRADYHLWPTGTYLQLGGTGQHLTQRKQQSHNPKKWQGLCDHLDLMPLIDDPRSEIKLDLLHAENQLFVATVALCKYMSPKHLKKSTKLNVISYAKGLEMAIKHTQNMVVLDSEDDAHGGSQQSMMFKLTCPITLSPAGMVFPVRGKHCNHFNCFDFESYLESNRKVSGGRWECPVCNLKHAAILDLEVCDFTKQVIEKCRHQLTSSRQTVELFADGRWQLITERPRYTNRSGQKQVDNADTKGARHENELIDLL